MKSGNEFSQDKILVHGDHVKTYLDKGYTYAPVTMELDLTNRCNNKCPKCTGYNEDSIQMDYTLAKRLIREFADTGVRGLIFTGGGEPLLHPNAPELVYHANNYGLDVGVITSGQTPKNFTDSNLEEIIACSKWLRVSLDAGSPQRYVETHGLPEARFNKALEFISKASELKAFGTFPCTIGVGYLTGLWDDRREKMDIERAAVLCAQAGADYLQLRPFHDSTKAQDFDEEARRIVEKINPDIKLLGSAHKYDHMDDEGKRDYDYCHGAHFASVVCADGNLYVCCHARNQDWGRITNLTNTSFQEAWNESALEEKVKGIDVSKCLPRCRCDNINRRIEYIKGASKNPHKSFL